ncbi:hypothetical protein AAG570_005800 [Ranatra chinensis]|uniref:Cytochrome c domain-containing protein n=1 Tax=Ranatra chinensis TaxID=642074 RepID=A0ABD0Y126_9HEMI
MGDAERGKRLFVERCSTCHTLSDDKRHGLGPNLREVFGRVACSASGYRYTQIPSRIRQGTFWTEDVLEKLLQRPETFMEHSWAKKHRVPTHQDREDIVAFLKDLPTQK